MSARRRGAIYARVSPKPKRPGQVVVDDTGVDRQLADCHDLAERLGIDVVAEFEERLMSAYSRKPRPAFEDLLARLDEFDVLLVWHPDRLIRQSPELERVAPLLEAAGVVVESVVAGSYDLSTAEGIFNARIHGAIATRESAQKAERIGRKHRALVDEGKSGGGGRPFGYEPGGMTVRDGSLPGTADEAAVVRELVARVLAGESLVALTDDLDRRGIVATRGGRWTTTSLRSLLSNPRIAGIRTTTEVGRDGRRTLRRETGTAAWPALVEVDDFRRVEAILAGRSKPGRPGARLLTGYLVCGKCGAKLVASKRAPIHGGHRVYICNRRSGTERGCFSNSILAEPLERILEAAFVDHARGLVAPERTVDVSAAETELERVAARRTELGNALADDEGLDLAAFRAATARLDERQRVAEETIRLAYAASAEQRIVSKLGDVERRWPTMTVEEKRTAIAMFVESIEIAPAVPGRGFDEDRIGEPKWRA